MIVAPLMGAARWLRFSSAAVYGLLSFEWVVVKQITNDSFSSIRFNGRFIKRGVFRSLEDSRNLFNFRNGHFLYFLG